MASILKVDEMQGVTSAGDITITGEGGSATQSLQQGLCKQWSKFDHTAVSVYDSFNTSSMSDIATGKYRSDFTNNMNNDDYCIVGTCIEVGVSYGITTGPHTSDALGTNAYGMRTIETNGNLRDMDHVSTSVNGDLA